MKRMTKLAALVMVLALLLTTAGCSKGDISWAAKLGDESLPGGTYAYYLLAGYNQVADVVSATADNILREKIDGQPVVDYIVSYAKKEAAKALSTQEQFHKLGLTIDTAELADALEYASYIYAVNADYFRVNKITETDLHYISTVSYMGLQVFNSIYGEGGEKGVPKAELMEMFTSGYTRSQYLFFPKTDDTGAPLAEEELAALKAKAEDYLARAKQEGQSFTDLIHELDQSNLAEGEAPYDKVEEKEYDVYLQNLANYYPAVYEAAVVVGEVDSIQMVEDENYIFIVKKLDIAGIDQESLDYYLEGVLQNLKYGEFSTTLEDWADRTDVVYNNDALKELTPKKMKFTAEQVQAAVLAEGSSSSTSSSGSESGSSSSSS